MSTYQTFISKKVKDEADTYGSTQTENPNGSSYKSTYATQLRWD